jgi:hypothetical protein
MRTFRTTIAMAILLGIPAMGLAFTPAASQTKPPAKSAAPAKPAAATHATTGVVKSGDATSLVITHMNGKKSEEVSFALNSTTTKKGDLTVGSTVDVRYRTEGSSNVATAVTVHAKKK